MKHSEIIYKNPVFSVLSSRERSVFEANATFLHFDDEEMFIKESSMISSVYFMVKGMAKICFGKKQLFWLSGSGDFLGLASLYVAEPIFFSAYAVTDTVVLQIDAHVFRKFIATNPLFLNAVFCQNGLDFRQLTRNNNASKKTKLSGAVAGFLLEYSPKGFLKHLTRKEIGEMLGYSRENITKIIQVFLKEKYIAENDRQITLLDRKALEQIARFG
ncbi:MAG: Crp/Fnr family transcriptional regulator [Capnocytophaga sp.]|nr:Crp/Fnr family transcriptional regulator [Capnocytophaga sp.]